MKRTLVPPEKEAPHEACFLDPTLGMREIVPLTHKGSVVCPVKNITYCVSKYRLLACRQKCYNYVVCDFN